MPDERLIGGGRTAGSPGAAAAEAGAHDNGLVARNGRNDFDLFDDLDFFLNLDDLLNLDGLDDFPFYDDLFFDLYRLHNLYFHLLLDDHGLDNRVRL